MNQNSDEVISASDTNERVLYKKVNNRILNVHIVPSAGSAFMVKSFLVFT